MKCFHCKDISKNRLVTNRTPLLALEPLVNALWVVLVRTIWQLLEFLVSLEVFEAYRAGFFNSITSPEPRSLPYLVDLLGCQSLADLAIAVLELHELLVCHAIGIRVVRIVGFASTRFDGLLKQPLFLSLNSIGSGQTVHHRHHDHLLLPLDHLLLIHLSSQCKLLCDLLVSPLGIPTMRRPIPRSLAALAIILGLVLQLGDPGPEIKVLLPEICQICSLLLYLGIFFFKKL